MRSSTTWRALLLANPFCPPRENSLICHLLPEPMEAVILFPDSMEVCTAAKRSCCKLAIILRYNYNSGSSSIEDTGRRNSAVPPVVEQRFCCWFMLGAGYVHGVWLAVAHSRYIFWALSLHCLRLPNIALNFVQTLLPPCRRPYGAWMSSVYTTAPGSVISNPLATACVLC